MKRFLHKVILYGSGLLIFLPTVCFSAKIQVPELQNSENYLLLKLHYSNSTGERAITDFEYDAYGNLFISSWELLSGERSSENRYVLDNNGLILEKHRVFSDSITARQDFHYNRCGWLLRETFARSDGLEGEVLYTYNDHGKLLEAECHNLNGWFSGKIKYNYNAYDVLFHADVENKDEKIGDIVYEYDINGNLRMEKWDLNGTWQQTYVFEYIRFPDQMNISANPLIHNSKFYRIEEEYYDYTGGGTGPSIYEYEGNKLVRKIFQRSDGLRTETTFRYDDSGSLLNGAREYSDGKKADIRYTYDEAQRIVSCTFKRSDGLEGEEKYFYDSEGRLAMAYIRKLDAWLTGTVAFSHDADGKPVKGYFKGENDFDAEIYLDYDDFKNLVKIRWDFSFGKSQVYTYRYRATYTDEYGNNSSLVQ